MFHHLPELLKVVHDDHDAFKLNWEVGNPVLNQPVYIHGWHFCFWTLLNCKLQIFLEPYQFIGIVILRTGTSEPSNIFKPGRRFRDDRIFWAFLEHLPGRSALPSHFGMWSELRDHFESSSTSDIYCSEWCLQEDLATLQRESKNSTVHW